MSIPATVKHVSESLSHMKYELDVELPTHLLDALYQEGEEVTVEINDLENQLTTLKRKIDALWEGAREYEYELVSVFMHRGESTVLSGLKMAGKTSGAGHYWTYQAHLPDHGE